MAVTDMENYTTTNTRPGIPSTLTFQQSPVDVLILGFGQRWIFVEQICHKGEVEFGVSADDVSRGDELSAAESVGLLQHGLCPLHVVFLLDNTKEHTLRSETPAVTVWWRSCECRLSKSLR